MHVAWFDEHGLNVRDVWNSAEQLETFVGTRLMPAVAEVGITSAPEVTVQACHAAQCELVVGGHLVLEQSTIPAAVYDKIAANAEWVHHPPIGAICHVAADAADGMVDVTSVWRSAQASINFAVNRLAPIAADLGFDLGIDGNPPPLAVVHAVYCPAPADVSA